MDSVSTSVKMILVHTPVSAGKALRQWDHFSVQVHIAEIIRDTSSQYYAVTFQKD